MEKQRARTEEEKEYRRTMLLGSARKLFSEKGYGGTRIEIITRDCGLSPGSFYRYFSNKLDIYRTLNLEGIDRLRTMMAESLLGTEVTASEKIQALSRAYVDFFILEREYYDIMEVLHLGQREFFSSLDKVDELEDGSRHLLKIVASIIDEGIKGREFRPVDSWKTAAALWGMMDGVLMLEVKQSTGFLDIPVSDLVEQTVDLVLNGLRK